MGPIPEGSEELLQYFKGFSEVVERKEVQVAGLQGGYLLHWGAFETLKLQELNYTPNSVTISGARIIKVLNEQVSRCDGILVPTEKETLKKLLLLMQEKGILKPKSSSASPLRLSPPIMK
ncbi:MAG: hypothetical protein JSR37_08060 [Verrucomicrobia bacterium]|nr:hypothetical protein [Verrucomicrobiota bacterium]MBS0637855.1 hypothetical protein [Verrucomicrobiota bacterium]